MHLLYAGVNREKATGKPGDAVDGTFYTDPGVVSTVPNEWMPKEYRLQLSSTLPVGNYDGLVSKECHIS
jgi:hypothetical protein